MVCGRPFVGGVLLCIEADVARTSCGRLHLYTCVCEGGYLWVVSCSGHSSVHLPFSQFTGQPFFFFVEAAARAAFFDHVAVARCTSYYVNRDTLFCYHKASELFLHRIMALYVASHYKNTPNDLQLLSDAPAHHVFVLVPPVTSAQTSLPDVLCVLQVCMEGEIARASVMKSLSRGKRASGDLIPWTLSQQVIGCGGWGGTKCRRSSLLPAFVLWQCRLSNGVLVSTIKRDMSFEFKILKF